jgi:hypothetical protein
VRGRASRLPLRNITKEKQGNEKEERHQRNVIEQRFEHAAFLERQREAEADWLNRYTILDTIQHVENEHEGGTESEREEEAVQERNREEEERWLEGQNENCTNQEPLVEVMASEMGETSSILEDEEMENLNDGVSIGMETVEHAPVVMMQGALENNLQEETLQPVRVEVLTVSKRKKVHRLLQQRLSVSNTGEPSGKVTCRHESYDLECYEMVETTGFSWMTELTTEKECAGCLERVKVTRRNPMFYCRSCHKNGICNNCWTSLLVRENGGRRKHKTIPEKVGVCKNIAGEMVEEEAEKSMLVEHPQPQVERHEVREGCLSGSKESLLIANKLFLCKKDFDKEPEQTRTLQIGCRNKQNEVSQFEVNDLTQDINEQENEVIPVK